jgi:hypothetical protein
VCVPDRVDGGRTPPERHVSLRTTQTRKGMLSASALPAAAPVPGRLLRSRGQPAGGAPAAQEAHAREAQALHAPPADGGCVACGALRTCRCARSMSAKHAAKASTWLAQERTLFPRPFRALCADAVRRAAAAPRACAPCSRCRRCAGARRPGSAARRTPHRRRRSARGRCLRAFRRFPVQRGDLSRHYGVPACAVPAPVARAGVALRCARHRNSCRRATQLAAASAVQALAGKALMLSVLALRLPSGRADGVYGKKIRCCCGRWHRQARVHAFAFRGAAMQPARLAYLTAHGSSSGQQSWRRRATDAAKSRGGRATRASVKTPSWTEGPQRRIQELRCSMATSS